MKRIVTVLLVILGVSWRTTPAEGQALSSMSLWGQYASDPEHHPNIPDCSYSGYHASETPLPRPSTGLVDVKAVGAKGDGSADDTSAFEAALARVRDGQGGVVFVPAGRYRVRHLVLGRSHMILRGAGPDRSVLVFEKSLTDLYGPRISTGGTSEGGESEYSWSDGLIHVGPGVDLDAAGALKANERYGWAAGSDELAHVTAPARRGDRELAVDDVGRLHAGQRILLAWGNPSDHSLLAHIVGWPVLARFPWERSSGVTGMRRIVWPVEISTVAPHRITLRQPLRLDVRPEWSVSVRPNDHVVEEVGVEDIGLAMVSGAPQPHHTERGFNGIFLHRVLNGWVRNVSIEDADSGVLLESTKNVTIERLRLIGRRRYHHGTFAKNTHDMLVSDFVIEAPLIHGINADILCSGLVWHRGVMRHGTFDMHHGMSFDLIRTDIDVVNDGSRGGTELYGPIQGAHAVHWNIRGHGPGKIINQPDVMPMGALVGVQGVPLDPSPYRHNFVSGDKGCLVVDPGRVPEPGDLFEAELALRLRGTRSWRR